MRKILQIVALSLMGAIGLFMGMFIIGETLTDPGGWRGIGLVALWLVPLVVVAAFAWLRPRWAQWLLGTLTAVVVGLLVWSAVAPQTWRDFENNNGPILAIAVFALAIPLTVLGWHRPLPAGSMLLLLGLTAPVALVLVAATGGLNGEEAIVPPQAALTVLMVPIIVIGTLLVLAGLVDGGDKPAPPATPPVVSPDKSVSHAGT
jgi:MFS family permease